MNELRKQLKAAMKVTPLEAPGHFRAELRLPPDFVGFEGHFPGNPILPGVCLVMAALVAVQEALGREVRMTGLKSAKFLSPVRPDDSVTTDIVLQGEADPVHVRAALSCGDREVAQLSLYVQGAPEPEPTDPPGR